MSDDSPSPPLKRRVPGEARSGPARLAHRPLPETLLARMQAAVDAAHAVQEGARAATDPGSEPVTEPLPRIQAAVAAPDSPASTSSNGSGQRGNAWAAGPDLTENHANGIAQEEASSDASRPADPVAAPELPTGAVAKRWESSGWDAFRGDVESGTVVKHDRAGWLNRIVGPAGGRAVRNRALAGLVVLVAVLIAAVAVALALTSRNAGSKAPSHAGGRAKNVTAAREARDIASAAAWVVAQVNRTAVVACDLAMCQALASRGFPDGQLRRLEPQSSYPLTSTLVAETRAVRSFFGTSLAANWAPVVLASFGNGADQINIRVMAPHGARAFESASQSDARQRKALGAGLITSRQISTTPAARSAMAAGEVDARLLIDITALASQHPIDILAFSRTWPGTSAGVPLRTADLAEADPAAGMTKAAYVRAMIADLRAQPAAYRPVHIATVRQAGRNALQIEFPAPSPLGLISPG